MSVERRLDRCIGNMLWFDVCSKISVSTLYKSSSDHFPLLFEFQTNDVKVVSHFKFLKTWSLHSDCKRLVELTWAKQVVGCHMFVLTKKIQMLKRAFREWNRNIFGNVSNNVK